MRKIQILAVFSLLFYVSSCAESTNSSQDGGLQKNDTELLQDFFEGFERRIILAANSIKKREAIAQRDTAFMEMMDTIGVFNNVCGVMDVLEVYDKRFRGRDYQELLFQVKFMTGDGIICANFRHDKLFRKGTLEKDYLYNQVKEIPLNSTVFFDGIVATEVKTNLPKFDNYSSEYIKEVHPPYSFHFLNISRTPNDTLSLEVRKTAAAIRKSFSYAGRIIRHESYRQASFNALADTAKVQMNDLSDKERVLIERYLKVVSSDISGNN